MGEESETSVEACLEEAAFCSDSGLRPGFSLVRRSYPSAHGRGGFHLLQVPASGRGLEELWCTDAPC